jgi:hypothetical protein
MVKKRTIAGDLSEASIVERAKSVANQWMGAVLLQHDRIRKPRPQDQAFHPFGIEDFNVADVHFLAIALLRIRRVATTIEHVPQLWPSVRCAIEIFDAKLPWLKRLRDVFEHLEDYAVDSNLRRSDTSRRELQVSSGRENGMQLLGNDIDFKEALQAAQILYGAVKTAYDSLTSRSAANDQSQDGGPNNKPM